jgi:hypothetical protein
MAVKDLGNFLRSMDPRLSETKYYFTLVDESSLMEIANYLDHIVGIFREEEGLTLIISADILEDIGPMSEREPAGPFALITLAVNSDLMAVGFLARVASALAKEGIAVNAISAYNHDHLFVPWEKKDQALAALAALSRLKAGI